MEPTEGLHHDRHPHVTVRPANLEGWADKSEEEKQTIVDALYEGR